MKKLTTILIVLVSLFSLSACGESMKETTCSFQKEGVANKRVFQSDGDTIVKMVDSITYTLKDVGLTKDAANNAIENWEKNFKSMKDITFESDLTDKTMTFTITVDLENGNLDTLSKNFVIPANTLKSKDGKQYASLKAASENFKEEYGESCK